MGDRGTLGGNREPSGVVHYFSPPPAELAEPLLELAGLFFPPAEFALFPPVAPLLLLMLV